MNASSTFPQRLKRLAFLTGAIGVAAAVFSAPAMADLGLPAVSGTVSGTVEQVAPAAADTVADVTSAAQPIVDQVPIPPADALGGTAGRLTEPVESVLSGGLGSGEEIAGTTPRPAESADQRARDDQSAEGTSLTAAARQSAAADLPGEVLTAATPVAEPSSPAGVVDIPIARTAPAADQALSRPATRPPDTASPSRFSPASLSNPAGPGSGLPARAATDAPTHPQAPLSYRTLLGSEGLLPPASASLLLVAATLALFALVVPRAGGPRLRPSVALLHAADVRFRLVRPG